MHRLGLALLSSLLISATALDPQGYARQFLSTVGQLETMQDGFTYVKVSEEYITKTAEFLQEPIAAPNPYHGVRKVGAHITAITDKECPRKHFLPQRGQPVVFKVIGFSSKEKEGVRYFAYTVDVPQVELIRLANGLPAKIPGQPFQIQVGSLKVETAAER